MEYSQSIAELTKALAKAQGALEGAKKDTANTFFKSKYADLESVWDACRKQLSENGLAVIQTTEPGESSVVVITTLAHTSGEWVRGKLSIHPVKFDPQGVGSAITYARRYALAAIVGVYQSDDDGNAASGKDEQADRKSTKPDSGVTQQTFAPADLIEGVVSELQNTDKGLILKIGETICVADTPAMKNKLLGAHGAKVKLGLHSKPMGKARQIINVLSFEQVTA